LRRADDFQFRHGHSPLARLEASLSKPALF
jgi:hypothetical protein